MNSSERRATPFVQSDAVGLSELHDLLSALTDISNMCVGEIAMSYALDAQHIGELIYSATGMTNPELNECMKQQSR